MFRLRSVIAVCLAMAAASLDGGAASATVMDITYTGTITNGADNSGLFGRFSQSLTGYNYSLVYSFDTDLGTTNVSADTTRLSGSGAASPGSALLTINGYSYLFDGGLSSDETLQRSGTFGSISHNVYDTPSHYGTYVGDAGSTWFDGAQFTMNDLTSFSYDFNALDWTSGYFNIVDRGFAYGTMIVSRVTVGVPASPLSADASSSVVDVSEPAGWALLAGWLALGKIFISPLGRSRMKATA